MKTVLITGHEGNVGAKTLTAGIVSSLRVQNVPALALDLCPSNLLRLHFGMNPADPSGIARCILAGQPMEEANYRNHEGIDFMPFGTLNQDEQRQLSAWSQQNPGWLRHWTSRLNLPAHAWLVCHAPFSTHALWRDLADHGWQLEVFALDALTLLHMEQAAHDANHLRSAHTSWVLNGFDATRRLDRDTELVVRATYQQLISPVTLHRDEHHREALAQRSTIQAYAPSSQGAHDMTALSLWLGSLAPMEGGL